MDHGQTNLHVQANSRDEDPMRVFVIMRRSSPLWEVKDAIIIQEALQLMSTNPTIPYKNVTTLALIAKELFDQVRFLVLDVRNEAFDFSTAHIEGRNDLPVVTVRLSKKKQTAQIEGAPIEREVNRRLREIYCDEGYDKTPPFVIDHTNGKVPTYLTPRSVTVPPRS